MKHIFIRLRVLKSKSTEKTYLNADTVRSHTTPTECARTVITPRAGQRRLSSAVIQTGHCMLRDCARTVTYPYTTNAKGAPLRRETHPRTQMKS